MFASFSASSGPELQRICSTDYRVKMSRSRVGGSLGVSDRSSLHDPHADFLRHSARICELGIDDLSGAVAGCRYRIAKLLRDRNARGFESVPGIAIVQAGDGHMFAMVEPH